jgi:RND family efflux transporter MFP subunit
MRIQSFTLVLAGAALALHASCSHEPDRLAAPPPVEAQIASAELVDLSHRFEAGGVVRARTTAHVVSRIVAEVREVRVKAGDRIRSGQVLIVLDSRELEAGRAGAEAGRSVAEHSAALAEADREAAAASLALAKATHDRIAALHSRQSATAHELDEAVAGLRAAEARAKSAEARASEAASAIEAARAAADGAGVTASYALLTSPFAGIVTEKLVEPGNMAAPGVPLLSIEDTGEFRLEVRLDASRAAQIDLERPVPVRLDSSFATGAAAGRGDGGALSGRVVEISQTLDPGSHAFLVKIALPSHEGLRSGLFGRASFSGAQPRRALAVPSSSIIRRGQLSMVFVVDNEMRARMRLVNVSGSSDDRVEIRSGLEAGERFLVSPPAGITDGISVRATGVSAGDEQSPPARTGGPGTLAEAGR